MIKADVMSTNFPFFQVVEQSPDAILLTDLSGVIVYANRSFERLTGYAVEESLGKKYDFISSSEQDRTIYQRLWDTINSGNTFRDVLINRRKDGSSYYEDRTMSPIKNRAGRVEYILSVGTDIAAHVEMQRRLDHLAHYDPLTGLPNRTRLKDRLTQTMARSRWNKRLLAIILIDLDRFKLINEGLGNGAGDQLLKWVGEQLSNGVREGDIVAHLGADEFGVLLQDIASIGHVPDVANKLLSLVCKETVLGEQTVHLSASMGVAAFPGDGEDADQLLVNAAAALHAAKQQGGGVFHFFAQEMNAKARDRLRLEAALRAASKNGEFRLHYQPQINLEKGNMGGVEALLRWDSLEMGAISPFHFIPLAEETGLIYEIGKWVLKTACMQCKEWQDQGLPPIRVAVNLSARQFRNQDLLQSLVTILEETGLEPSWLELEITESAVMEHEEQAIETLHKFRKMGMRVAMDDFGTGYSSLGYLKRLPIDVLKIDRAFIKDLPDESGDLAIVETVIALARTLGLEVVAEGVETKSQLDLLKNLGCDCVQGYLFSRPVPADQLTEMLTEKSSWSMD